MMRPFANIVIPPVRPLTNYNVPAAQTIKAHVSIPVIVVGGIRSLDDINQIIMNQQADMVSMCRPFIIEPDIVKKLKEGKEPAEAMKAARDELRGGGFEHPYYWASYILASR